MNQPVIPARAAESAELMKRAGILFVNFFLIILAYYQVKGASRTLLVEFWGADRLPYVWIISALVLGTFIGFYHRLVERHSRLRIVLGSLLLFMALLVVFRALMAAGVGLAAVGFYIFVDIVSVILVEQFWSLANTVNQTEEGKKSYWFVGTGGLVGGVAGGAVAAFLLEATPMTTEDLLLSCAASLGLIFVMNLYMARLGLYEEVPQKGPSLVAEDGWRALVQSRYILLIAAALLCSQMVQPVVEYQFIKSIEISIPGTDARTIWISKFFSILGLVSIAVNLVATQLVHRFLGAIAGVMVQPIVLAVSTLAFMAQPLLLVAGAMKIADRGLSYSINRASKELLYIPVDPVHTYQAKAWIDMLGYRLFKVAGSALVLWFIDVVPIGLGQFGWLTIAICAAWLGVIAMLAREYNATQLQPAPA